MKTFIEYLNELAFAVGKDSDYTGDKNKVLVFSEESFKKYKETTDKTHGLESHAIKHLPEFDDAYIKTKCKLFIDKIKTHIDTNPKQFIRIYNKQGTFSKENKSQILQSASNNTNIVLNCFDVINDKMMTSQQLLDVEKIALPFIKDIGKRYGNLIEEVISKAVVLKGNKEEVHKILKTADIIKISEDSRRAYYLNMIDNSITIQTTGKINTMYKFGGSGRKAAIQYFVRKFYVEKFEEILKSF